MSRALLFLSLFALTACGPIAPADDTGDEPDTSSSGSTSAGVTTITDRQQTSSSAPLPETDSADTSPPPDLGAPEPTSGTTGDGSTSTSSSDDGNDATSSSGGPPPACYGEPCDGVCGAGMACLPHPHSGVAICVTLCPAFFCDVGPALCSPTGAPPLAECIRAGCFPILCEILDDCPDGAIECAGGLCF